MGELHDWLLRLNDSFELYLSDKQLQFVVVGLAGVAVFLAARRFLRWLGQRSASAVGWVYTATAMLAVTLAIEIGQKATGTGHMEVMDIAMGLWGVAVFGVAYMLLAWIMRRLFRRGKSKEAAGRSPGPGPQDQQSPAEPRRYR